MLGVEFPYLTWVYIARLDLMTPSVRHKHPHVTDVVQSLGRSSSQDVLSRTFARSEPDQQQVVFEEEWKHHFVEQALREVTDKFVVVAEPMISVAVAVIKERKGKERKGKERKGKD